MSATAEPPNADALDFWSLFKPLSKQLLFLKLSQEYRFILYGGARGGGKSRLLRWGLLWFLLEQYLRHGHRGVKVGLFCETYKALQDRQISKIAMEFPSWIGSVKATQTDGLGFHLHDIFGGGAILLRNLDDPSKYMSAEYAGIAVDELTKHDKPVFDILRGSLRWPGISQTFFWAATNPGGVGHLWVKGLWIDKDFPPEMEGLRDKFAFVQSLPADNPYLDQEYWDDLNSLPEQLRRAWVEGLWDVFVGQAFGEWRDAVHVKKQEDLPVGWRVVGGMDWGYDHPGWFGLLYVGPEGRRHWRMEVSFGKGSERYDGCGAMTAYDAGFKIGTALKPHAKPQYIALDAACWAENFQGAQFVSDAELIQQGINAAWGGGPFDAPQCVKAPKGPGSRATRKTLMHALLKWTSGPDETNPTEGIPRHGQPKMTVHPDCKALIATLPSLVVDDKEPSKIDKKSADDPYDGATYAEMTLHAGWEPDEQDAVPEGRHPGHTSEGGLRSRDETLFDEGDSGARWQSFPDDDLTPASSSSLDGWV